MKNQIQSRQATTVTPSINIAKTLMQTAGFWAVFLFIIPAIILRLESLIGLDRWWFSSSTSRFIGVILFGAFGMLGLSSGIMMSLAGKGTPWPLDCTNKLVVAGPYRFIRNPMVIAGLAQGMAVGVFFGSPAIIVYSLVGAPVWHFLARPWEERDMELRFGADFLRYRKHVRCWIPRLTPYRAPDSNNSPDPYSN